MKRKKKLKYNLRFRQSMHLNHVLMCDIMCVFIAKIHSCLITKFLFENELLFDGNDKIILELKSKHIYKRKELLCRERQIGSLLYLVKIRINFAAKVFA